MLMLHIVILISCFWFQRIEDKGKEYGKYIRSGEHIWFVRETGTTFFLLRRHSLISSSFCSLQLYKLGLTLQDQLGASVEQLSSFTGLPLSLIATEMLCLRSSWILLWMLYSTSIQFGDLGLFSMLRTGGLRTYTVVNLRAVLLHLSCSCNLNL